MSQRIDILTNNETSNSSNSYVQVIEAHKRLNRQIDDMTHKIGQVVQKNQSQFILAYQNHVRKIKIELAEIRNRTDAHQKQMSKNDRVTYLQKQVTVFRQQALKLYDRLEQKTQESQIYKIRSRQLQKTCLIAQKQVKQHMKQKKIIEARLVEAEQKIAQLEQQMREKQQQNRKALFSQESNTKSIMIKNLNLRFKQQSKQESRKGSQTVAIGLGGRRKSVNLSVGGTIHVGNGRNMNVGHADGGYSDGQLKDWFLECVKSIKKDVAQRKNNAEQNNFQYVKSIQEFKMVDKLKLLQKFMQNQKLLIWMYQKIFPSRIQQIKQYLSKHNIKNQTAHTTAIKKTNVQSQQRISEAELYNYNINIDENEIDKDKDSKSEQNKEKQKEKNRKMVADRLDVSLPKMNQKNKRSQVRNKILIRDGKLNLTMF